MDEYATWEERDLHRKAFENIDPAKPGLAKQMQDALAANRPKGYEISKATECLTCHATDRSWKVELVKDGKADQAKSSADALTCPTIDDDKNADNRRFFTEQGVNCQACHGVVDNFDTWLGAHANLQRKWRANSPEQKLAMGQLDLRNPITRAERCVSCHVGNKAEGKFVTHEMYAAGHPPLLPFESGQYGEKQPAHYYPSMSNKYFNDEPQNTKEEQASLFNRFNYRKGESAEVRALAYGAAIGLRSSLELMNPGDRSTAMLDFAHFDCAACHHDLKKESDRQKRPGGITGRPLMKAQTELLDVILEHAGNPDGTKADPAWKERRDRFAREMKALNDAFTAKPFGDNDKIKTATTALDKTIGEIIKELQPIVYDERTTVALLDVLHGRLDKLAASNSYIDYDSALQLAWALLTLHRELTAMKKDDAASKANEVRIIKSINAVLPDPLDRKASLESVENRLKERLKKQYEFKSKDLLEAIKRDKGR